LEILSRWAALAGSTMKPNPNEAFEILVLTGLLCIPVFIFLAVYFVLLEG